jgi:hypothetical protein
MIMTVYNQYSGIELASPIYFCNHEKHYEYPVERTRAGSVMRTEFRFDPDQDEPGGILVCKVRRKSNATSDRQTSVDTIYARVIEEAANMMLLLVTWKIEHLDEPKVNIILVEYDNELVLNEDKLAQLYDKNNVIPFKCNRFRGTTWLMCGDAKIKRVYCAS